MRDRTRRFQRAVAVAAALVMVWELTAASATQAEESSSLAPPPTEEVANGTSDAPDDLEVPVFEEHDPWEGFNARMFTVNRNIDRYAFKPVATVWDRLLPDVVQTALKRAFDNLAMPRRLVNTLLQLDPAGAGRELARFGLNTTVGVAGLFDVAGQLGIEGRKADTGQTLGVYGVGPGPYLVLPLLPPLTVRDGIGYAVDAVLDPFNYVIFPGAALVGLGGGERVNDRSRNLEEFEAVEETTVDLYSAVRNAYLQRRQRVIDEGRERSPLGRRASHESQEDYAQGFVWSQDYARGFVRPQEEEQAP